MKKIFTSLFFLTLFIFGSQVCMAQLEPVPLSFQYGKNNVVEFDTANTDGDVHEKNYVTNTADEEISITWVRSVPYLGNEAWTSAVCDKVRCYLPHINTLDFTLAKDEKGELTTHLYLNEMYNGDSAVIYLKLFRDDIDNSDTLWTKTKFVSEQVTSSTMQVVDKKDVSIYPNPATSYFNIKSPARIKSVVVYDLLGNRLIQKEVRSAHSDRIDISTLRTGTYFVTAFAVNGERLKTMRLLKRSVSP